MESNDIILLITTIVAPIISGVGAYLAAIAKAKKDIDQLREQNKHEIDKLMNQHRLDLESLERKHQMEIEKIEIEHRHKLQLLQKEMETKVGMDFNKELMAKFMDSPALRDLMHTATQQELTRIQKKRR